MFPNELQIAMHQKELVRDAEQHHLALSLREDQPSLWARIRAHLSIAKPSMTTSRASATTLLP